MRPSSLRVYFPISYIYILSLFLQNAQVRAQALNGWISITGTEEFEDLNVCLQNCVYLNVDSNGLANILGCALPVPNACYCNADKLQIATNAISSCITADCTNVDNLDISTAIKAYNDYCSTVSAEDIVVTTDVAGATKSNVAAPSPTQTAANPTSTNSGGTTNTGGNSNCEIVNSTGNNSCDDNSHNAQTSGASSSGLGKSLSLSDKIAIGVGLGIGIPSVIISFIACMKM